MIGIEPERRTIGDAEELMGESALGIRVCVSGAEPVEATLHAPRDGGPFVLRPGADSADVLVLPSQALALVSLDDLLDLTLLPDASSALSFDLDLDGYAALLCAADALRAARLRSILERAPERPPQLTAAALDELLQAGLASPDTRWTVTCAAAVSPSPLAQARIGYGLRALERAGILSASGEAFAPTDAGAAVIGSLARPYSFSLLAITTPGPDGPGVGHITVLRTWDAIWLTMWSGLPYEPRVTLLDASAESALGMLRDIARGVRF